MIDLEKRLRLFKQGYWEVPDFLDTSNFDFDWRPDPHDRPYIHQFGTQHQKTGGPRFVIPENEGIKYQSHQIAIHNSDHNNRCWRQLLPHSRARSHHWNVAPLAKVQFRFHQTSQQKNNQVALKKYR